MIRKRNLIRVLPLFIFITIIQFFFCNNEQKQAKKNSRIKGRYVNSTFIKKLADTVPGGVPFYCTQMEFFGNDTVDIANGFEDYQRSYKKDGDHYLLIEASFRGDMPFVLNTDSSITLIDTGWTHLSTNSEFKKVPENRKEDNFFDYYLNEEIIAGEYVLYKDNKATHQKITFDADGRVRGFEDYVSYSLCYSGDCVGETAPPCKTISLVTKNQEWMEFALKIDRANGIIRMYNIADGVPDIKGDVAIMGLAFELRK